jgi:hypothetical protein
LTRELTEALDSFAHGQVPVRNPRLVHDRRSRTATDVAILPATYSLRYWSALMLRTLISHAPSILTRLSTPTPTAATPAGASAVAARMVTQ